MPVSVSAKAIAYVGKIGSARTNFQKVLDDFGDSEFAGPAAYALAVLAFRKRITTAAQPLFHKAAAKSKDASVALSAKYFEARCLENTKRADDALNLYLQVAEAKSQYREDARTTAGGMLLARGRRTDALKQYEALASEAEKPATRAEAAVRAGLSRSDLAVGRSGQDRQCHGGESAHALAIADAHARKPENGKASLKLVSSARVSNRTVRHSSHRLQENRPSNCRTKRNRKRCFLSATPNDNLVTPSEAEELIAQIIDKFPSREEAKDARYQRLINLYNSDADSLVIAEVDEFLENQSHRRERADSGEIVKSGSAL